MAKPCDRCLDTSVDNCLVTNMHAIYVARGKIKTNMKPASFASIGLSIDCFCSTAFYNSTWNTAVKFWMQSSTSTYWIDWAKKIKFKNFQRLTLGSVKGPYRNLNTKFEVAETKRGRIKTGSKFRPPQYYRPKIRGRQTTPSWVSAQSPDSKMTKKSKSASITVEAETLTPFWFGPVGLSNLKFGFWASV